MAWYKQPIRPLDPVIEDDPDSKAIRYYVSDFSNTGQDSHTIPPAQDQSLFQGLTNIMPPLTGSFRRRWGQVAFGDGAAPFGPTSPITRMYNYQSDIDLARRLVLCTQAGVMVKDETGTTTNSNLFTPSIAVSPRMAESRSTAYFCTGQAADNLKWDSVSNTVTKTGIDITAASSASGTIGPTFPGTATDISSGSGSVAWTNVGNITTDDGNSATVTFNAGPGLFVSHLAQATNFGYAVSGTIAGIKVEVKASGSRVAAQAASLQATLINSGVEVGVTKSTPIFGTTLTYYSFGGSTDLWGSTFTSTQVNAVNFGVSLQVTYPTNLLSPLTINIDAVRVTLYLQTSAITFTSSAGNVTLTIGRTYYYAFKNSRVGHYSDLSIASASTGAQTSKEFTLTLPQPNGSDPQVDTIAVLATADGNDPTVLFTVQEVPKGTTSIVDNTNEATLLNNQVLLTVDASGTSTGLALNSPPPAGTILIKHKGRMFTSASQQFLYFSKSVDELTLPNGFVAGRYEESWPAVNFMDISEGAETITALLSDGNQLYIGTQSHIRVLFGDGPLNFQKPQIVHNQVGVVNQEVMQMVYVDGSPLGAMWLTPDLRVIGSDFNTYTDAGAPIQDVLDLNTNPTNSWGMFVSQGEFNLYILAIPTGRYSSIDPTKPDTFCVFDLKSRRWSIWTFLTTGLSAGLFNITATGSTQWLMAWAKFQNVFILSPTDTTESITSSVRSSWLHFGMPTTRKLLNDIGIIGDVGNMLVTVEGANTQADFLSPKTVIANAVPVLAPLGVYKVFLAGRTTKYRYYRITLNNTGTAFKDIVDALNVKVIPINTL